MEVSPSEDDHKQARLKGHTCKGQLIQKSVLCEIQMGGNKIKGKGIHELKQSLNVLCMQRNLH